MFKRPEEFAMQRRKSASRARDARDLAVGIGLLSFAALILCGMIIIGLTGPASVVAQGYGIVVSDGRIIIR
jgi:hypothetical protein